MKAVSRYGARFIPDLQQVVERCAARGQMVDGPEIAAFERALEARQGGGHAVTTSCGRMAGYHIFKALDLPPGSEVIFPALTFWVVPEMARIAGLKVVFADVDPVTFNLDPAALERAITPRTKLVVPTHIYGLPCDMDAIVAITRKHGLRLMEDCAHALGATYKGQPVGTFGDAALFSFQVLKPLNTLGGGCAYTRDPAIAANIRAQLEPIPKPTEARVRKKVRLAKWEKTLIDPDFFSYTVFPILWAGSLFQARPDVYLWEKVRPLFPFPDGYLTRYSNLQASVGLRALEMLDGWNGTARKNALWMSEQLSGIPGVIVPPAPTDRVHVYYQYPVYVPDRDAAVKRALRSGLDLEYHHMDVCPDLDLFAESKVDAPGAQRTTEAVQLPVHSGLTPQLLAVVADRFRRAVTPRAA